MPTLCSAMSTRGSATTRCGSLRQIGASHRKISRRPKITRTGVPHHPASLTLAPNSRALWNKWNKSSRGPRINLRMRGSSSKRNMRSIRNQARKGQPLHFLSKSTRSSRNSSKPENSRKSSTRRFTARCPRNRTHSSTLSDLTSTSRETKQRLWSMHLGWQWGLCCSRYYLERVLAITISNKWSTLAKTQDRTMEEGSTDHSLDTASHSKDTVANQDSGSSNLRFLTTFSLNMVILFKTSRCSQ